LLAFFKVVSSVVLENLLAVRPFASRFLQEGKTMQIRKIAVVGGFAAGAALAFAPLASADDLTTTLDSEIAQANTIFQGDLTAADVPASDYSLGGTGVFDTINAGDVATVENNATFDDLVFGLNPANESTDPGAYDVFNGALVEFDDAYNSLLYAADYSGNLIPAADLFGSATDISTALATDSDFGAAGDFLSNGFADLVGLL
jgi:hypothetical protein